MDTVKDRTGKLKGICSICDSKKSNFVALRSMGQQSGDGVLSAGRPLGRGALVPGRRLGTGAEGDARVTNGILEMLRGKRVSKADLARAFSRTEEQSNPRDMIIESVDPETGRPRHFYANEKLFMNDLHREIKRVIAASNKVLDGVYSISEAPLTNADNANHEKELGIKGYR